MKACAGQSTVLINHPLNIIDAREGCKIAEVATLVSVPKRPGDTPTLIFCGLYEYVILARHLGYSGPFGPYWVILGYLGYFGPFWATFGPSGLFLALLGYFGLEWLEWPIWPKIAQNGPKWRKWPRMASNDSIRPKWPRMARMSQNSPEGPKMAQMAQNGPSAPTVPKSAQMAQIGWFGQGWPRTVKIAQNDPKGCSDHTCWKVQKETFLGDTLYMWEVFGVHRAQIWLSQAI